MRFDYHSISNVIGSQPFVPIYKMPQLTLTPAPTPRSWRLPPPSDPVSASEGSLGPRLVAESVL